MNLSPYQPVPPWQPWVRWGSGVGMVIIVGALGLYVLSRPTVAKQAEQWVEMVVNEVKPPPPPPPPPEPEPEKPPEPPKPKAVQFKDIPKDAPPPEPLPASEPQPKPVRRVQGLTANSFATGSNTGLTVRAGNTTTVAAGKETMDLSEATGAYRPYTSVTKPPSRVWTPELQVPDEAKAAKLEGTVKVSLDIDEKGKVVKVVVVKGLGMGVDEACAAAWKQSKWRPAEQDGVAVPVLGVPEACKIVQVE